MATRTWIGTDTGNEGDWATPANWTGAAVPVADDDVYFEDSSQSVTTGLDQSAIELDSLNIAQSFTGQIGDVDTPLQVDSPIVNIGYNHGPGSPSGSPLINLQLAAVASVITVFNTGTSADSIRPPLRIRANKNTTTLEVLKGKVGIATETGETTTIGPITVNYTNNKSGDVDLFIGDGCTLTTIDQKAGDLVLQSACTTLTKEAGTLRTEGAGTITALNHKGGTATMNSTGTIATTVIDGGIVDFTKSSAARTATNMKINPGGALKYNSALTITTLTAPDGSVTLSASAA